MTTSKNIWEVYIESHIVDAESHNVFWAGPNAIPLPLPTPVHVITACNPHEQKLSVAENIKRNNLLEHRLEKLAVSIKLVIGRSDNGDWQEPSFAIFGLNREQVCALACEFNQRAIFELSNKELLAIEAGSCEIKASCPRKNESL